jgi:predicted GNAT superfamily acetyltransferase
MPGSVTADVEIRPLESIEEFGASERLQRRVWAMPDDRDVIPLHLLLSAQRNGALVLGAFDHGTLVGLLFGYLGMTAAGRLKHCSHLMGIAPEIQGRGVGYRLKLAQREFALRQGCHLVTWTYDPLESRNANLNIHKLGAVSRTYRRDFYGPMDDGLNRGLPSDRFQVDWWISSDRVLKRVSGGPAKSLAPEEEEALAEEMRHSEGRTPGRAVACQSGGRMWVEIPAGFQAVRASNAAVASELRAETRRVFEERFSLGYAVTDFLWREGRAFYLLTEEKEDDAH